MDFILKVQKNIRKYRNDIQYELDYENVNDDFLNLDLTDVSTKNVFIDEIGRLLGVAYCKNLLNKYRELLNPNNVLFNTNTKLLELCIYNNFDSGEKDLHKTRFDEIINLEDIDFNYESSYFISFIDLTYDHYFIDRLIEKGVDINRLGRNEQTSVTHLFYKILSDLSLYDPNCYSLNKLKYLMTKGGDINKGSIREISGVQYEDRPLKVDFIHFLIRNGLQTHNRILYTRNGIPFMLYESRLGKVICQLIPDLCD
jgi:hypothetical protein